MLWAALAVVAVVGWWWWPSTVGRGPANDVLVLGNGDLTDQSTPVIRRLRERGLSVVADATSAATITTWCDAADRLPALLDEFEPAAVVVSYQLDGGCGDGPERVVAAVGDRRAVLVVQPGAGRQEESVRQAINVLAADNIAVADPSLLLGGDEMPTFVGCQWWDDCLADGSVEIRDVDGALTVAGGERVARVLVSVIA